MEGSTTRIRRRIFIVDRNMQSDFVIRSVIVLLIFSALILGTMFWSIRIYDDMPIRAEALETVRLATHSTGIVFVLVLTAVTCFFIYLSHRVAGPAFRLKKTLVQWIRGDYSTRVNLRKGDYLRDVAGWFNRLGQDLEARREHTSLALQKVEVLRDLVEAEEGSSEKARELVRAVADALQSTLAVRPLPDESS